MNGEFRGSRKHILSLLENKDYLEIMNGMLADCDATISADDPHSPIGFSKPQESTLGSFWRSHLRGIDGWLDIIHWWSPHNGKSPTWDLISTCLVRGKKGLVLVEAKAHVGELRRNGKSLRQDASDNSRQNHKKIGKCIEEASKSLNEKAPGVNLSRDRCYQLANRVAFAWKVSQLGLPVVLMYLGFLGDNEILQKYKPFANDVCWQSAMRKYLNGILPQGFCSRTINYQNGGSFCLLIKSLPIGATVLSACAPPNWIKGAKISKCNNPLA